MYEVVTMPNVNTEEISKDLNLPIEHVQSYFGSYDVYKKYPIRDLTFEETQLVQAIKEVKMMTDQQLKNTLDDFGIEMEDLSKDQLLIERKLSRYNDEERYTLTRKYQHFILEPAILHGNMEAPITRPLDMENVVVLLSNIALGLVNQKEDLDSKTKIAALSKIADIYTATKALGMGKSNVITTEDLNDLSPKDLTKLINQIKVVKTIEETIEPVVQNKKQALEEIVLFD